ncbi:MAG TPA: chromosome segregation protein SMC, partial [Candidatus Bathyarchaeia archaeon]|nr:chromosome segregation protein SMC [Candidatus Bathyarchaeia archaeon]
MSDAIKKLTIEGFKSIRKLDFEPRSLNIMIGANGAGKSNFVSFFRLLREMIEQRLKFAISTEGGAEACLYMGRKMTKEIVAKLYFGDNGYEFALRPTADNLLVFSDESTFFNGRFGPVRQSLGSGHVEAKLKDLKDDPGDRGARHGVPYYVFNAVSSWVVYHFHDTS